LEMRHHGAIFLRKEERIGLTDLDVDRGVHVSCLSGYRVDRAGISFRLLMLRRILMKSVSMFRVPGRTGNRSLVATIISVLACEERSRLLSCRRGRTL
jgi:hypothetical protein